MATPEACAMAVLSAIPEIMQGIRCEVRRRRDPGLSVPQFRTLIFIYHNGGASLSQVAEHVGLSRPSMSKMIEGLVRKGHVGRQPHPGDRRRVSLDLTPGGRSLLSAALGDARKRLAELLRPLRSCDRAIVVEALKTLRQVFHKRPGNQP